MRRLGYPKFHWIHLMSVILVLVGVAIGITSLFGFGYGRPTLPYPDNSNNECVTLSQERVDEIIRDLPGYCVHNFEQTLALVEDRMTEEQIEEVRLAWEKKGARNSCKCEEYQRCLEALQRGEIVTNGLEPPSPIREPSEEYKEYCEKSDKNLAEVVVIINDLYGLSDDPEKMIKGEDIHERTELARLAANVFFTGADEQLSYSGEIKPLLLYLGYRSCIWSDAGINSKQMKEIMMEYCHRHIGLYDELVYAMKTEPTYKKAE